MEAKELTEVLVKKVVEHGFQPIKVLTPEGEILTINDVVFDPENECLFIQSEWEEECQCTN